MLIPQEKISEIINASDIVDVISESVILKKSGRNYMGLCPFHSEKSPSFSVSPDKQLFHCFGCSAGGNVFSFLMKLHGISFPEAVKMTARKYNITVEMGFVDPEKKRQIAIKEGLFRLNSKVMAYYAAILKNNPGAERARQYLTDRGISRETIETFSLGYAEDRWDGLVLFFRQLKLGRQIAQASGLVIPRDRSKSGNFQGRPNEHKGYYDRFRNRIIFPIMDISMQVAGFGGRVMDDAVPKYLNSPETPVYSKGEILYGLHVAKQYCRQEDCVYIVEGYFDFLSLFQNGIKNTVASLGTALTVGHVRRLKGYATRAVLVFDSDNAGIKAAKRSVSTFASEGVDVKILVLPKGQDPDSFIRTAGVDAFKDAADRAMSVMNFLTDTAMKKFGTSIEGKIAVLDEMKDHLAGVEDSAARSLYVRALAQQLGIDEAAVLEKVRKQVLEPRGRQYFPKGRGGLPGSELPCDSSDSGSYPGAYDNDVNNESYRREEQMLAMMIQYPGVRLEALNQGVLDYFYCQRFRRIGVMLQKFKENKDMLPADMMAAAADDYDRQLITSLAMMDNGSCHDVLEKSVVLMKRIVKVRNKNENILTNEIRRAEQGGDSQLPFELLKKLQRQIRKSHGYE